jgi:lipopolysaccharide transport protein LptA
MSPVASMQNHLNLPTNELVSIRAEQAWEDELPNVVHFRGEFILNAGDWSLHADEATVNGRLDNPDSVDLIGTPAEIAVIVSDESGPRTVKGEAPNITYNRSSNSIMMTGGATLSRGDNVMTSGEIEYDIDTDRFRTGGTEGVSIRVKPAE